MTEIIIRDGEIFEYEPWGGDCIAMWVNGELWMTRNINETNGSFIWKTIHHTAPQLLITSDIPLVTILWENTKNIRANMPNENIIRIWLNNEEYSDFKRKIPITERFQAIINTNDMFYYEPWGSLCTTKWVDGELWIAKDINQTSGNYVWKTLFGDGQRLLNQGTVALYWENQKKVIAYMPNPETIRVWNDNSYSDFIKSPSVISFVDTNELFNDCENSKVVEVSIEDEPIYLTLEMARIVCDCAQLKAAETNTPITISIYDNHGNLKLFERMDSIAYGATPTSHLKGLSSASFPASTRVMAKKNSSLPGYPLNNVPDLLLLPGGLPIILKNTHIGSIGVSSPRPDLDEECAQAGVDGLIKFYNRMSNKRNKNNNRSLI